MPVDSTAVVTTRLSERQKLVPARHLVFQEEHFEVAANDAGMSKWLYAGYILSFSLVDLTALMRLSPTIPPWVHVLITLLLSTSAVVCITLYVRATSRVSHYRTAMLRRLMYAHNERADSPDVGLYGG